MFSAKQDAWVPGSSDSTSHRSTWLIHDEYVGVKCSTKLGRASSQRWTAGALRGQVVADHVDRQGGVGLAFDLVQEVAEAHRPVLGGQLADH